MSFRKTITFLFVTTVLLINLLNDSGCANIIPPEGGPRDSLPPNVQAINPHDSTLRFTGDRISFSFDEYIDLDNPQQNLIVSPLPKNSPTVTRKLNSVIVKLRDTLESNTTYVLNFGNSLKDVNEGNIIKNFTYVFSTGSYIDSLRLSGKVVLAEKGTTDSTLSVILHRTDDDSALVKIKPRYVTRVDPQGNYAFTNLPPGTYYLYALQDQGGSYRYQRQDQLFAFADSAVVLEKSKQASTLYAYATPEIEKPAAARSTRNAKDKRLKFTTNLVDNKQDLLGKLEFTFETRLKAFDSSRLHFSTDSAFTPVSGHSWLLDSTRKKATLNTGWKENTSYHLILDKDFATDTLGQQLLRADTINFTTKTNEDYGRLLLRMRNVDLAQNPVLLFIQNDLVVLTFPLTSSTFSQRLFPTGEYSLRLLSDKNKNGVWDPGVFFGKHLQPEIVKPLERKITVKANWDNEIEFDINAPPPPATPVPGQGNRQQRTLGNTPPVINDKQ